MAIPVIMISLALISNLYFASSQDAVDIRYGLTDKCETAGTIEIGECIHDPATACYSMVTCACNNGQKEFLANSYLESDTSCSNIKQSGHLIADGECTLVDNVDCEGEHHEIFEAIDESEWDQNCDASLCEEQERRRLQDTTVDIKFGFNELCDQHYPPITIGECFEDIDAATGCHIKLECICENGKKGMSLTNYKAEDTECVNVIESTIIMADGKCTLIDNVDCNGDHHMVHETTDESEWDENCDISLCQQDELKLLRRLAADTTVDVKFGFDGECDQHYPPIIIDECFQDTTTTDVGCHNKLECSCDDGIKAMILTSYKDDDTECVNALASTMIMADAKCTLIDNVDCNGDHHMIYETTEESEWDENCDISLCD